jgi:hypothetical protein
MGSIGGRCPELWRRVALVRCTRKVLWYPFANPVLFGRAEGRDRGHQCTHDLGSRAGPTSRRGLRPGKPVTPRGRSRVCAAGDAAPIALLLGARDAACGELALPWKAVRLSPHEGVESKA